MTATTTEQTSTNSRRGIPRLKQRYRDEIAKALQEEFSISNVMQIPNLSKITVNMGVGEAARDSKLMDGAVRDLATITGQKPVITRARKSIAQFKLREGMPIGAHVTLRGDRMWEFADRLLTLALPRIRDFRGLSPKQFDGNGNYTFGLNEQVMFHEINQDKIDRVRGMDITFVTTRDQRRPGPGAVAPPRLPVPDQLRNSTWLRQRSGSSRPASRSSPYAPTPGARSAAGPRPSTASSASAGCACARWPTRASCPASPSPAGNTRASQVPPGKPHERDR